MPDVAEEITSPTTGNIQEQIVQLPPADANLQADVEAGNGAQSQVNPATVSSWRSLRRARTVIGRREETQEQRDEREGAEYESELVDILDLVGKRVLLLTSYELTLHFTDPEVQALQTLTNVQNSLVVPYLGKFLNRRPTYTLSRRPADEDSESTASDADAVDGKEKEMQRPKVEKRPTAPRTYTGAMLNTITSRVNDKYYAVLPHGVTLPGWSEEEKLELNDHVRHMMHSKRSKFKRGMKGFGQYVRKRRFASLSPKHPYLRLSSSWTLRNRLRNTDYTFRFNMGPLPYRLDQRWRPARLHNKCNRQRPRRSLRHHRRRPGPFPGSRHLPHVFYRPLPPPNVASPKGTRSPKPPRPQRFTRRAARSSAGRGEAGI